MGVKRRTPRGGDESVIFKETETDAKRYPPGVLDLTVAVFTCSAQARVRCCCTVRVYVACS